jgi:DNA mismatch endonuclease (patch repair protein)
MADVLSPGMRHYNMTQIRSKDTKIEMIVRKYLFSRGLRYRVNDNRYPGKPDIVLPKYQTMVFVHGCFWHKHDACDSFKVPVTNRDYWLPKLTKNQKRDEENIAALKDTGWKVIVVWECELKKQNRQNRLEQLFNEIVGLS